MTTALIVLLLLVVVVPAAMTVYAVDRRTSGVDRTPFSGLLDDLREAARRRSAMAARASGPDGERIDAELRVIELWHRDCA